MFRRRDNENTRSCHREKFIPVVGGARSGHPGRQTKIRPGDPRPDATADSAPNLSAMKSSFPPFLVPPSFLWTLTSRKSDRTTLRDIRTIKSGFLSLIVVQRCQRSRSFSRSLFVESVADSRLSTEIMRAFNRALRRIRRIEGEDRLAEYQY